MVTNIVFHLHCLAMDDVEFKKSCFYKKPKMVFENHDITFSRNAENYIFYLKKRYKNKWDKHLKNITCKEYNEKIHIYYTDMPSIELILNNKN